MPVVRRLLIGLVLLALVAVVTGCQSPVETEGGWFQPAVTGTA
jgi:hypothetical protein